MASNRPAPFAQTARYGVLLGLAGGIAEIIWIAFYSSLAGSDASEVARAISAAVGMPGITGFGGPVVFGLVVHMVAAVGIGVALVFAWRGLTARRRGRVNEYAFMVGALTIIWAFNFFVVLPLISPAFVELVPYPVSLMSKLLFGLAGAAVLRLGAGDRSASIPLYAQTLRVGKEG